MAFSSVSFDDLCAEIVRICQYYLGDTASRSWGKNVYFTCPNCHKPKLGVSTDPSKPVFHCFVCGLKGNAITLIQLVEDCTVGEAVAKAKEILGMPVQDNRPPELYTRVSVPSGMEEMFVPIKHSIYQSIWQFYARQNSAASHYWQRKFITPPPPEGYVDVVSSKPSLNLIDYLAQLYPLVSIAACPGFITVGGNLQFSLNNHILIPYWNEAGDTIVAFNGRAKHPKDKSKRYLWLIGESKHLYIPRGVTLNSGVDSTNFKVITEGEKKAIVASAAGIPTVAVSGVECFDVPELRNIDLHDRFVLVCYDRDKENPHVERAEQRLASYLEERGANVKVIHLPLGYKLDDFIQERGKQAFWFMVNAQSWSKVGGGGGTQSPEIDAIVQSINLERVVEDGTS